MAVDDTQNGIQIPEGCYRQPTESEGLSESGDNTFTYVLKGGYAALKTLKNSLKRGDVVEDGWLAKDWNLQRGNGGTGTLSITCMENTGLTDDELNPAQKPLRDVWKIHAVRNDISLLAYCGGESPSQAQRVVVEKWMRETDSTIAAEGNYREKGEIVNVASTWPGSADVIAKMQQGIETVARFYPVITRTRTYATPPPDCLDKIGYIDTPPVSSIAGDGSIDVKHPKGLAAKLAGYEWLKMQDDCDETTDGKWTRTESWWGAEKWDTDLYGPNRWSMPHQHGEGNNGNNENNGNNANSNGGGA